MLENWRRFARFSNKASLHRKQGFFELRISLVCNPKKPCFYVCKNDIEKQSVMSYTPLVSCSRFRFFSHVL